MFANIIFAFDFERDFDEVKGVLNKFPDLIHIAAPNSKFLQHKILNSNFLHIAAKQNEKDLLKKILDDGYIDPNSQNSQGNTALHMAVLKNNVEIVSLLLEDKRINVNIQNKKGYTALHLACYSNNNKIVEVFNKLKGTNLSLQNTPTDILHNKEGQDVKFCPKGKKTEVLINQWRDRGFYKDNKKYIKKTL